MHRPGEDGAGSEAAVGHVTSADIGPTVGASIAHAWLPAADAAVGTPLEIAWFGERLGARVVTGPLYDPTSARQRGREGGPWDTT